MKTPQLSIIAPAHNEQENIPGLLEDIDLAMRDSGIPFEVIIINDGSTDGTLESLTQLMPRYAFLRVFSMTRTPAGKGNGQSAAFYAGIRQAQGELIALLDADRQNDPADLPAMFRKLHDENADMVQGDRSHDRRDTLVRRVSSWVGRTFRRVGLGDTIRDTGCSLRIFKKEIGLQLPLQYKGLHRFIPVYARLLGYRVVETPVHHRARTAGEAKYGVWNRALPGLFDLLAVRWMRKRMRPTSCEAIKPQDRVQPSDSREAAQA